MAGRFGKPDATGRSSGKRVGKDRKRRSPPKGEPWVWFTRELLESEAWGAMSINARRVLDALLLDHMAHAGCENGRLCATYDQLVQNGVGRRHVRAAFQELDFLGLVKLTERGGRYGGTRYPSMYRLTFYTHADGTPATNDWKAINVQHIEAMRTQQRADRERRKQISGSPSCTPLVHLRALDGGKMAVGST